MSARSYALYSVRPQLSFFPIPSFGTWAVSSDRPVPIPAYSVDALSSFPEKTRVLKIKNESESILGASGLAQHMVPTG